MKHFTGLILLVDHSRAALTYQETVLRRREGLLATASSGSEALTKIRERQPRLVMFGFDLFDMNGAELCAEVRDDPSSRATSLLFIVDHGHEDQIDQCMASGCNDVLFRPFTKRDLEQKIAKLTTIPVRKQVRTLTKIEVSLENNGFFVLGHSVNICSNGMLIQADHVLPPEGSIRVHFYIPGDPAPLHFEARIVRAEFTGSPHYGVEFNEVSDRDKERIELFVKRVRSREFI